jgi:hypothetical protein
VSLFCGGGVFIWLILQIQLAHVFGIIRLVVQVDERGVVLLPLKSL